MSLQILIQIDEIEFDACATQFQKTIVNAIIDSEVVTVIVLSDDDA
jgi:hypothetical protein